VKNLLYISLILLLFSCTKGKGNIYAEGRVYNPITGEGHSGIEMKLIRTNAMTGDPFEGSNRKHEQTVITDEKGRFVIEHIGNLFGTYILQPRDPSGTLNNVKWDQFESAIDGERPIEPKEELYDNFQMVPFGYIKRHTKNVNCEGPNDSMHIELTYLLTGVKYEHNNFNLGCFENLSGPTLKPIGDYRNDWYVIRNGVRVDCTKVFTIYENDTTFVERFY
jgi:hypothetical protein